MPEDATRDFGAFLRDARERAGVDLRTIATRTKISMVALEAMERNDVSRLPGGIFVRAFVRAYAGEVGLDPETTVNRFVARFPETAGEELSVPEPVQDRQVLGDERPAAQVWRYVWWSAPIVIGIAYFAFGGRLGWVGSYLRPSPSTVVQSVEQPPPAPETPVMSTPVSAPLPPPPQAAVASDGGSGGPEGSPAEALAASASADAPAPAAVPALSEGARRPSETITAAATEGRFTMTLKPSARCWVTVRSNGQVVFSGTMQPGDRQNLVLGGSVSLTVGNAAAMSVDLDGSPARALGAPGEVRTIRLTAGTLKDYLESR